MHVFLANQVMWDGTYHLAYGKEGTTELNYPSHNTRHRKYSRAIEAKNALVKKFKKL